ncbi:hypothetical protein ASPCADRAFT_203825 [Aspergillus carbonarius ITEM 5010]|uniref:Uncharacterized protein n=1 Tax=Aspergillus carbonarius (strain ITEM 5010) TaxID=602072 RepID=A0A1R3RZR6_ASPC5|nr:hypothetical protein ASPCADRAFT_203825 [Aspergillus carbonarius ITEM 5010]
MPEHNQAQEIRGSITPRKRAFSTCPSARPDYRVTQRPNAKADGLVQAFNLAGFLATF